MSEQPRTPRLSALVFLSVLSMVYAEVYSGSSPLWFVDPFALIVALPLYGTHTVLLVNLAVRYRRATVSHLYLFGVFFGLYESWITKVLWAGYPGSTGPQFGTVLGVAWAELSTLVLFWHPMFSFVIPVLVFQSLAVSGGCRETLYGSGILSINRRSALLWTMVAIFGGTFMPLSPLVTTDTVILAAGGNMLVVALLHVLTRRRWQTLGIRSVLLGRRGMTVLSAWVVAQYAVYFFLLVPERYPGLGPSLVVLCIYVLHWLVMRNTPTTEEPFQSPPSRTIHARHILTLSLIFVLLATTLEAFSDLGLLIGIILMLSMIIAGPFLYLIHVRMALRLRRSTDSPISSTSTNESSLSPVRA